MADCNTRISRNIEGNAYAFHRKYFIPINIKHFSLNEFRELFILDNCLFFNKFECRFKSAQIPKYRIIFLNILNFISLCNFANNREFTIKNIIEMFRNAVKQPLYNKYIQILKRSSAVGKCQRNLGKRIKTETLFNE